MSYFSIAKLKHTRKSQSFMKEFAITNENYDGGHKIIWMLFSSNPEDKRDFIFRKNENNDFLIVSNSKPIFDNDTWDIKTKDYNPDIKIGQRFGFSIKINPTKAKKISNKAKSQRVDVIMHEKYIRKAPLNRTEIESIALDWLGEKLSKVGAKIDISATYVVSYTQLRMPREKAQIASLSVLDIEGVLEVTEPTLLKKALLTGIGSGKAFGLGMLLLRPCG